jgi:hypothetical protein
MTYPISLHSTSGRFAGWLGKNLLAYAGGAIIFAVGFLVFATVYAHFVQKPAVIRTQPAAIPTQPPVIPTEPLPSIQTAPNPPAVATPPSQLQLPVPIAKLTDQDLVGKKLVSPKGVFLGYIVSVERDPNSEIISLRVRQPNSEPNAAIVEMKIAPHR